MATSEPSRTPTVWDELRKPFPPEVIGQLPKGGVQLDYVGHAAVTDRLLTVDPAWTWAPLATDEYGRPVLDADGNLWIKLTVHGVTRIGVGDGKNAKERISDALRNAAMRFGVALDLWSKDELESTLEHPELKNEKPGAPTSIDGRPFASVGSRAMATEKQIDLIKSQLKTKGVTKGDDIKLLFDAWLDHSFPGFDKLTKDDASTLIDRLIKTSDLQSDLFILKGEDQQPSDDEVENMRVGGDEAD